MLRLRSLTITTLQTPHVKGGVYLQICNFYFIKVFVDLVFIGFYVTLSAPDVKEAGNALEKDGTHLHLQLHTQICLQKKRENDDCFWEKWNSCTFYVDFNFLRWLSKRHCDCDCDNHEKGTIEVENRKGWQRSTSTVWAPTAAIYGSSPP